MWAENMSLQLKTAPDGEDKQNFPDSLETVSITDRERWWSLFRGNQMHLSNICRKHCCQSFLYSSQQPYHPQQTMNIQKTSSAPASFREQPRHATRVPALHGPSSPHKGSRVMWEADSHLPLEQHLQQHPCWRSAWAISRFCSTDLTTSPSSIIPPKDLNLLLLVSSILSRCPILAKEIELL